MKSIIHVVRAMSMGLNYISGSRASSMNSCVFYTLSGYKNVT